MLLDEESPLLCPVLAILFVLLVTLTLLLGLICILWPQNFCFTTLLSWKVWLLGGISIQYHRTFRNRPMDTDQQVQC